MTDGGEKQPNPILRFFSRPAVGVAGSLASIIGIGLSVYLFLAARETPELTYFVHPAKAAVVRTGQTSRLAVQFDGQTLTGDVTAAQVAFWNAGRKPIRAGAILSPLHIRTGNQRRILEVRLQKTSRDVVGLQVDTSRLALGEVAIRWDILEQNDGGVVQIVYLGNEAVEVHANAVLEGQPAIVRLGYDRTLSTPSEQYARRQGWKGQLPGYVGIASGVLISGMSLWPIARRRRGSAFRGFDWVVLVQGPVMLAMGVWMLLVLRAPGPPFGF